MNYDDSISLQSDFLESFWPQFDLSRIIVGHNLIFFKLRQLFTWYKQRTNPKLGKEISYLLVFLKIFSENDGFATSKGSLTSSIKENNHFFCMSKLVKFH